MSEAVVCELCPHHCRLSEGGTGFCGARGNRGGEVVCLNYGQVTSLALDPIEKKPLYHFHPGSVILSLGSYGCNLRCPFCQNYEISQAGEAQVRTRSILPDELLALALQTREQYGSIGVAFTYNEPLVSYEYLRDCAQLLRTHGLAVVLVTNGQACAAPLSQLLPLVDAMNVDLKGFSQEFYTWLQGNLVTTKQTIQMAVAAGVHVEVTTLVIPGRNDSPRAMSDEASWLASLSPDLPLHISRYFPRYHCDIPQTPRHTLAELQHIARRYLHYVYVGNV
ncbi:MAG: AmmeMemoRadiSam system radical SAM enzyme [Selenomonadaceae bacterium]|nr:AmmeMemoRadiSam system radical SAM enzyme [Selenomonadaceae bacterium]